jgi:hypothetical protein
MIVVIILIMCSLVVSGVIALGIKLWTQKNLRDKQSLMEGEKMARPRVIKLPNGGELIIKNGTPELVEQLKAVVLGQPAPVAAVPQETPQPIVARATVLSFNAVGISDFGGEFFVDKIQYDPIMGQATIVSHVSAGYDRGYAGERFKITVAESDLV